MFKKLLESLDAISSSTPKKANESKYPWLDHKDRPGAKKDDADGKKAEWKKYKADSASKDDTKKEKVAEAAKEKGNYYVEKEDGEWHVFHTENSKAFGTYSEKSEADEKAKSLNEAVTLTADGDEAMELINGMRKLAGMSPVAGSLSPVPAAAAPEPAAVEPAPAPVAVTPEPAPPVSNAEQTTAAFASLPADSWDDDDAGDEEEADDNEQMVVGGEADEEDDEEVKETGDASIYANSPDECTQDASAVTAGGDDMHKKKSSYPATAGGDNPMKAFEGKFKAIMADLLKE